MITKSSFSPNFKSLYVSSLRNEPFLYRFSMTQCPFMFSDELSADGL